MDEGPILRSVAGKGVAVLQGEIPSDRGIEKKVLGFNG
jgi:hypothetical protein